MANAETSPTKKQSWFKRHKVLTVIGVVILIAILASATGDKSTTNTSTDSAAESSDASETKPESMAKIGEAARDGKFEFVIKSVECGKPSVGANEYLTKTAQGQYCLLNLSVKNIGNEAQSLFSSEQKLFNGQGQEYAADDTATIYHSSDSSSTWYTNINPGNSVEGAIVFDIPKDQTPTTAELHDSAFSGGVSVSLQ